MGKDPPRPWYGPDPLRPASRAVRRGAPPAQAAETALEAVADGPDVAHVAPGLVVQPVLADRAEALVVRRDLVPAGAGVVVEDVEQQHPGEYVVAGVAQLQRPPGVQRHPGSGRGQHLHGADRVRGRGAVHLPAGLLPGHREGQRGSTPWRRAVWAITRRTWARPGWVARRCGRVRCRLFGSAFRVGRAGVVRRGSPRSLRTAARTTGISIRWPTRRTAVLPRWLWEISRPSTRGSARRGRWPYRPA